MILYLTNDSPHCHDYGIDFLFHGLTQMVGYDHVWDFPERRTLHELDGCAAVSDQSWPRRNANIWDIVPHAELIVIAIQPGDDKAAEIIFEWMANIPRHIPVVAADMSDTVTDNSLWYMTVARRPLAAYFKREVSLVVHGAIPLPLTHPSVPVDKLGSKSNTVFYYASSHDTNSPSVPRTIIADGINSLIPAANRDIKLCDAPVSESKLPLSDYYSRLARASVGVNWNGAQNWDSVRFWENFAYGVAQVSEAPRIRIPFTPQHGIHCIYVNSPDQVAHGVKQLIDDPIMAVKMGQAGYQWFEQHHSSRARAAYFLQMCSIYAW